MARIPTTRSRVYSDPVAPRVGYIDRTFKPSGNKQRDTYFSATPRWPLGKRGMQITTSEGHPFRKLSASGGDIGGEFSTRSESVQSKIETRTLTETFQFEDRTSYYSGHVFPFSPDTQWPGFPPSAESSNASLDAFGATAVARCEPTNSVADASTFLGELLKDGLPHLIGSSTWKARTATAKNAGDEFLNVEFGWLPIVSDVRKFAQAVAHADTVLAQYERDAGRSVRRRYHFPSVRTEEKSVYIADGNVYGPAVGTMEDLYGRGRVIRTRVTSIERWFSGAFTYHLPHGYDSRDGLARKALLAQQVLGVRLTPEVLWNLAPWSWAVDWFSNAGDVIHNVSHWASNGLVMRYGYMMETSIVKDTYTHEPSSSFPAKWSCPPISFTTIVKKRRRANPFGFGITWSGLSPLQAAIAAALGMSRSR